LGFANRDPDQAARVSDGCAYVLIGVEPGDLAGTAPIDIATLEQRITSYTGPDGPEWDANYVEYDSKYVLVVTVEAPRWGDTIFALAKNVGPYENGRVFVRRPGRTTPARAEELQRLVERARLTRRTPQLEVAWFTDPPAMPPLEILEADTEKWLGLERERLLAPLQEHLTRQRTPRAISMGMYEFRSPEEFTQEVDAYLDKAMLQRESEMLYLAMKQGIGLVVVVIRNATMDTYRDVEVKLSVPAGVSPFLDPDELEPDDGWAKPPRPLGSGLMMGVPRSTHSLRPRIPGSVRTGTVEIPGPVVRFHPVDVRPNDQVRLPPLYLTIDPGLAGSNVTIGWSATSMDVSGEATGKLTLPISEVPYNLGPTSRVLERLKELEGDA
jgi:hypothetical protein